MKFKDETGSRYFRLLVTEKADTDPWGCVRWTCLCDCGNSVVVVGKSLRSGHTTSCGCFLQEARSRISVSLVDKLRRVHENTAYEVIDHSSGRSDDYWTFRCRVHGDFTSPFRSIANKGTGCPACSVKGFNSSRPSTLYILSVASGTDVLCYKIGITNVKVKDRIRSIRRGTSYEVSVLLEYPFRNGADALALETAIKRGFAKPLLSRSEFKDGYTETFSVENLPSVINEINTYKETK